MFMDAIGMLLLTLPVVFPAVMALGYDPIWFGIILVKMVEICLIYAAHWTELFRGEWCQTRHPAAGHPSGASRRSSSRT